MRGAIVTGGSRGIGRAVAARLAAEGYGVLLTGTKPAQEADAPPPGCTYMQAPSQDRDTPRSVTEAALERFGRIDVLVNNAGMAPRVRADLLDMAPESMEEVLAVNLIGPFLMTQAAARVMEAQGFGVIVNIGSISAEMVSVNRGEYCISKAGVSMMTKLFAARMAQCGVLVYEVRPGVIETDMTGAVKAKYDALFSGGLAPINRWGQPEDVAEAVAMLCGGGLRYSTGDVLHVDGGMHIARL